jgi:hypothetical protein
MPRPEPIRQFRAKFFKFDHHGASRRFEQAPPAMPPRAFPAASQAREVLNGPEVVKQKLISLPRGRRRRGRRRGPSAGRSQARRVSKMIDVATLMIDVSALIFQYQAS